MLVAPLTNLPSNFQWPPGQQDESDMLYLAATFLSSDTRSIMPCDSSFSTFCSQHNVIHLISKVWQAFRTASDYHYLMDISVQITQVRYC